MTSVSESMPFNEHNLQQHYVWKLDEYMWCTVLEHDVENIQMSF